MAAETGFLINGTIYEVPSLYSLDNDECVILFDYCGIVQEDFSPLDGEAEEETDARNEKQMRHPGFWVALMHISYRRAHRELKDAKIKAIVGKLNRQDAVVIGDDSEEDEDGVPLASTSEQHGSSLSGSLENESSSGQQPVSSGSGSTDDSDRPEETLAATGALR